MKRRMILLLSLLLLAAAPMTAFAGEWRWNHQHGWYYVNDDGSSPYDGWMWIDGRCYCFDAEGFLLTDTVTPDGYAVNQDGAWIVNGIVQEQGKPVNTKVQVTPWFSFEAPESWEGKYFWRVNEDRCVTFYSTANEAYGGQIFSILARGLDEEDTEMLQDTILAAIGETMARAQEVTNQRLGSLTGGMPGIPGLF